MKHPLEQAADALEAEANMPRNARYRAAWLDAAEHYRREAVRLAADPNAPELSAGAP